MMKLVIRAEDSLTLQGLVEPLQQVLKHSASDTLFRQQDWNRLKQLAEPYRGFCEQEQWEREERALASLLSVCPIQQKEWSLFVLPLPIPAALPLSLLVLVTGLYVNEVESSTFAKPLDFSPLTMVWLREAGVLPIRAWSGKLHKVIHGERLAILELEDEKADRHIPRYYEQKNHESEHIDEGMLLLQVNLDDTSPEWLAYVMEQCLRAGANDVHFLPVTMKKSRPGTLLQVMCYQSQAEALKTILFTETTTFGIRSFPVACHRLARRFIHVQTEWGEVAVKLGYHQKKRVQIAPEYAVCAKLAEESNIPLKWVYQQAIRLAEQESDVNLL
ncbi:nickel insertion protein [Brevibacillus reuszeri]|uniref:nickel insertion protein n=1 Tax=Brevibacillus reuszeri TaxID=54915 RepID=UPI00289EC919|nr:nickel insertion protein [Brevibacillus reuszeri]